MKKKIVWPILLSAMALMSAACSKDVIKSPCPWCGEKEPLEDIKWINRLIHEYKGATVFICTYNEGKEGFLIDYCPTCVDHALQLWDCEGNIIGIVGGIEGIPYSEYDIDEESIKLFYKK